MPLKFLNYGSNYGVGITAYVGHGIRLDKPIQNLIWLVQIFEKPDSNSDCVNSGQHYSLIWPDSNLNPNIFSNRIIWLFDFENPIRILKNPDSI